MARETIAPDLSNLPEDIVSLLRKISDSPGSVPQTVLFNRIKKYIPVMTYQQSAWVLPMLSTENILRFTKVKCESGDDISCESLKLLVYGDMYGKTEEAKLGFIGFWKQHGDTESGRLLVELGFVTPDEFNKFERGVTQPQQPQPPLITPLESKPITPTPSIQKPVKEYIKSYYINLSSSAYTNLILRSSLIIDLKLRYDVPEDAANELIDCVISELKVELGIKPNLIDLIEEAKNYSDLDSFLRAVYSSKLKSVPSPNLIAVANLTRHKYKSIDEFYNTAVKGEFKLPEPKLEPEPTPVEKPIAPEVKPVEKPKTEKERERRQQEEISVKLSQMSERPLTDKYYISLADTGEYVEVAGKKITIPGYEEFDLFIHHPRTDSKLWTISEGKTGHATVQDVKTQKEAIDKLEEFLDRMGKQAFIDATNKAIRAGYISPRYLKPIPAPTPTPATAPKHVSPDVSVPVSVLRPMTELEVRIHSDIKKRMMGQLKEQGSVLAEQPRKPKLKLTELPKEERIAIAKRIAATMGTGKPLEEKVITHKELAKMTPVERVALAKKIAKAEFAPVEIR